MKKLFSFELTEEIEKLEEVKSKDNEGNEVTTKKPVTDRTVRNYFLKKPTRKMFDEAELFYGVVLSDGIKAGLLTRALLAKRFDNDGGVLNDDDKKRYSSLYFSMFELQNRIQRASLKLKKDRTDDENADFKDAVEQMIFTKQQIQDFEASQSSLFEQTAENRARNKTIMWWTLSLAHEEQRDEEGKVEEVPFFGVGSHEDKLSVYDEFEEGENEFVEGVMRKFAYYVSFWYVGKANKEEDFEDLARSVEESEADETDGIEEILDELAKESVELDNLRAGEKEVEAMEAEAENSKSEPDPEPDKPEPEPESKPEPEPESKPEPEPAPKLEPIPAPEREEPKPKAKKKRKQKKENDLNEENSGDETTNEKPSE